MPEPLPAGNEDELAGPQGEVDRPHLEDGLGRFVDVAEHDVAHLDPVEALARLVGADVCLQRQSPAAWPPAARCCPPRHSPPARSVSFARCPCTPRQRTSGPSSTCMMEPPFVSLKVRDHEHHGSEQQVHRALREHQLLEGFALAAHLDVGRVLDTSTTSSNRSSLRDLLSLTSLKPSRRSISRSNSRFSHSAASRVPPASSRLLK